MVNKKIINTSSNNKPYFGSIVFLLLAILLTISLFGYNKYLEKSNKELETNVSELDLSIKDVESDDGFKVFSLIDANKKTIEILKERSKLTNYIKHMEDIATKYDLVFRGFNASNSNIKTSILLESNDNGVAYKKLVKFISDYRKDENALFKLDFINRTQGYDNMKVNIDFEIK